jgi:hypothetical protein
MCSSFVSGHCSDGFECVAFQTVVAVDEHFSFSRRRSSSGDQFFSGGADKIFGWTGIVRAV